MKYVTPRNLRIAVMAFALVAVLVAWIPKHATQIRFVYSTDAKELLTPVIKGFNEAHEGEMEITHEDTPSGTVLDDIVTGEDRPTIWMPAASTWARLANLELDADVAPMDPRSFFWSPQVIGTFEALKEEVPIDGWGKLVGLGTSGREDDFRFGHTDPLSSTSGLYAMVSEFMATSDHEPIVNSDSIEDVQAFERSVLHYGDIARDFCDILKDQGEAYVTSFYMQETTFLKCTTEYPDLGLEEVFASEGTFIADYPFLVMKWASPDEVAVARAFESWIDSHLSVDDVLAQQFRSGSPWDSDGYQEDPAPQHADQQQPRKVLDVPDGDLLVAVREAWRDVRKPADILLVMQSTGMSQGRAIGEARELLRTFLDDLPFDVRVGLSSFGSILQPIVPLKTMDDEDSRRYLKDQITAVEAENEPTALYDAVGAALDELGKVSDPDAIKFVVVVSTGIDDLPSQTDPAALNARVGDLSRRQSPVQIFTISFGQDDAGDEVLAQISLASLGDSIDARPEPEEEPISCGSPDEATNPCMFLEDVAGLV